MKKLLLLSSAFAFAMSVFAETYSVKSPDGLNEIKLITEPVLSYSVLRAGKVRIAPTPISMEFDKQGVLGGKDTKVLNSETVSISGSIDTPIYKKACIDEAANETTITFKGDWQIVMRARNDGVAYRFVTKFPNKLVTVKDEEANLVFPSKDLTLYAGITGSHQSSWESIYKKTTIEGLKESKGKLLYLPLLVQYPDGVNLCVTESDLLDYAGWNFEIDGDGSAELESSFAKLPDPAKIKNDQRHRWINGRLDYIVSTRGTRAYPWRLFIMADQPVKLMESDAVYALAEPSRLKETDWVKPGKVAWDWWNDWNVSGVDFRAGCNTETYKYYIDFAAKNGIEYVIMDEGWSVKLKIMEINPEVDVEALVEYANSKGVGIVLWCSWPQLVDRQDEVFQKYAGMGVKGFKIDFMDRDDSFVVDYLAKTAEIAAKYRLILDYHGMYKPTGIQRTYPNIVNFEGVHGLEVAKFSPNKDMPGNDLKVFFTRMTAGPMDYTPGAMRYISKNKFVPDMHCPLVQGTRVHQMALMCLYEAPLQMLCDSPTQYMKNQECFDFMKAVPVVWDETVGLVGDVDKFAAAARRKGNVWYAGAIAGWDAQDITIETKFLGEGEWIAEIFEDGINADREPEDYKVKNVKIVAGQSIDVKLAPGGGWTARFTKPDWFDKVQFWK